jgi:hypothetical protein
LGRDGFLYVAAEWVFADRKYLCKVSDLKNLPDILVKVAYLEAAGTLPYLDYQSEEQRREKPHIDEVHHDSLNLFIFKYLEDFSFEAFNLPVSCDCRVFECENDASIETLEFDS